MIFWRFDAEHVEQKIAPAPPRSWEPLQRTVKQADGTEREIPTWPCNSVSTLLNDVIADYQLKDRHSLNKMARPLIEDRLLPVFGRMRRVRRWQASTGNLLCYAGLSNWEQ